jgi:hypothetical protein
MLLLMTQFRYCFPLAGGEFVVLRSQIATANTSGGKAGEDLMQGVHLAMLAPATAGFFLSPSPPIVKQTAIQSAIQGSNNPLVQDSNTARAGGRGLRVPPCAPVGNDRARHSVHAAHAQSRLGLGSSRVAVGAHGMPRPLALRKILENWLAGGRCFLRNWSMRWRTALSVRSNSEGGKISGACPLW